MVARTKPVMIVWLIFKVSRSIFIFTFSIIGGQMNKTKLSKYCCRKVTDSIVSSDLVVLSISKHIEAIHKLLERFNTVL